MDEIDVIGIVVIMSSVGWVLTAVWFGKALSLLHSKVDAMTSQFDKLIGTDSEDEQDANRD